MKTKNILLALAIILMGCASAFLLLGMPETNNLANFIIVAVTTKAAGFVLFYYTCRLVAYFNKINDIVL